MSRLSSLRAMFSNVALPWAVLFIVLSAAGMQIGGTNALSRLAALKAMSEEGTLNVDHYRWSEDWSLSPNGHYYSNKAPGAALLGAPLFAMLDRLIPHPPGFPLSYTEVLLFVLAMQVLPFAWLVCKVAGERASEMRDRRAIHFFALASLFGNTAALYMNCYFGHGLAALFFLAGFYRWLRARYTSSALLVAAGALTDYGVLAILPFFFLGTWVRERRLRPLGEIFLGLAPVSVVWAWYHVMAFGSPLALAVKFTNPDQIVPVPQPQNLWGIFSFLPSGEALYQLLLGTERGILFTQPWVLAVFPLAFVRTKLPKGSWLFVGGGLLALLWMNAGFGGWHGGMALGPRYLSVAFPATALLLALAYTDLPLALQAFLSLGLIGSVAFRIWVYPFSVLPPLENLWFYHYFLYGQASAGSSPYPLLCLAILGFAATSLWVWRRE